MLNVKRILHKRISDAVREEHQARYEYVRSKILLEKYLKREMYIGRIVYKEYKVLASKEIKSTYEYGKNKHKIKLKRMINHAKNTNKIEKYKNINDQVIAMEIMDEDIQDEASSIKGNKPVVEGEVSLNKAEEDLLNTHIKEYKYSKIKNDKIDSNVEVAMTQLRWSINYDDTNKELISKAKDK